MLLNTCRGLSLDSMDYERVRNVATEFKNKTQKLATARIKAEESQNTNASPRSFKFGARPRRRSSVS